MSVNDNSDSSGEARPGTGSQDNREQEGRGPETRGPGQRGWRQAEAEQEPRSRTELEGEKLPDPPPAEGGIAGLAGAEGEAAAAAEAQKPAGEVAALREEVAALKDQVLRTAAELENARKRHAKDREDAVKYAASKFAKDVLDVADNLRRAIDSAQQGQRREDLPEPVRNLIEGVEATERSLLQAFERNGIARIEAMGEKFNPNLHEAMFEMEDPSQPAGTVVQVLAPGYTIADRLLRPAQVGVSRGGQAQPRVDTKA